MENTLGIIAGKGLLPLKLIQACLAQKRPFVILALHGQTDPALVENVPHTWVNLGAIEEPIRYFHEHHVEQIIFAGAIQRPSLRHLTLDKTGAKWLAKIGMKAFGDDGLLSGILDLVEEAGFFIVGVQDVLGDLQVPIGVLGQHQPSCDDLEDIQRGVDALKVLGSLDMGQALIVEEGVILSVEGAEGTDGLIERTKSLHKTARGGVLVKLTKPSQSHRVDLPTIGPTTLECMAQAGLKGLAIQAHATLVLEKEKVIKAANEAGIFMIAVDPKWPT